VPLQSNASIGRELSASAKRLSRPTRMPAPPDTSAGCASHSDKILFYVMLIQLTPLTQHRDKASESVMNTFEHMR
jgi:hypothetical protein